PAASRRVTTTTGDRRARAPPKDEYLLRILQQRSEIQRSKVGSPPCASGRLQGVDDAIALPHLVDARVADPAGDVHHERGRGGGAGLGGETGSSLALAGGGARLVALVPVLEPRLEPASLQHDLGEHGRGSVLVEIGVDAGLGGVPGEKLLGGSERDDLRQRQDGLDLASGLEAADARES